MKPQFWLPTNSAIGLLSVIFSAAELDAQDKMHTEPPKAIDSSAAFRWLRHGKLYTRVIETVGIRNTCWVYKDGTSSVALTSSINGVSTLVDREIRPEGVRDFVANDLPELLVAFLSFNRTRLLNSRYLSDYEASIVATGFPPEIRGDQRSLDMLKSAFTPPKASFIGAAWRIDCMVVEHDGAVERWKFSGEMTPFRVKTWARESTVPANQVRPLRESGGP